MRPRWAVHGLLLLTVGLAAGCGESSTDPLSERVLERYQMWFQRGILDYSMAYNESCLSCPAIRATPVLITVRNGVVAAVIHAESGESMDPEPWREVATISGVYQRLLNHLEQPGASVIIDYDQEWDIPRYTQAYLEGVAGAGFAIWVSDFRPE